MVVVVGFFFKYLWSQRQRHPRITIRVWLQKRDREGREEDRVHTTHTNTHHSRTPSRTVSTIGEKKVGGSRQVDGR